MYTNKFTKSMNKERKYQKNFRLQKTKMTQILNKKCIRTSKKPRQRAEKNTPVKTDVCSVFSSVVAPAQHYINT